MTIPWKYHLFIAYVLLLVLCTLTRFPPLHLLLPPPPVSFAHPLVSSNAVVEITSTSDPQPNGNQISAECVVVGYPSPSVVWQDSLGNAVTSDIRTSTTVTANTYETIIRTTIIVDRFSCQPQRAYRCSARNTVQSSTFTTEVTIDLCNGELQFTVGCVRGCHYYMYCLSLVNQTLPPRSWEGCHMVISYTCEPAKSILGSLKFPRSYIGCRTKWCTSTKEDVSYTDVASITECPKFPRRLKFLPDFGWSLACPSVSPLIAEVVAYPLES